MKKYILAAALVLASTSAMADRTVSADNLNSEYGVVGGRESKGEACSSAKHKAAQKANSDEQVESYSRCDCSQRGDNAWICSVDATIAKSH